MEKDKKEAIKSLEKCIDTLQLIIDDSSLLHELSEERRIELFKLAGLLSRPDRNEQRKRNKEIRKAKKKVVVLHDRAARATTGIRSAREFDIFSAPVQLKESTISEHDAEMKSARNCYVCKAEYTKLHHFYDAMCDDCGDLNYRKRFQRADLTGQVAIITGARVKIGFQATLMMLQSGATVVATTRFPVDAAIRFSKEKDYDKWKHRLHIHGLDLRHTPSVELFTSYIEEHYDRLDILINNAAQTVRRPPGFYTHMMDNEELPFGDIPEMAKPFLSKHFECVNQLEAFGSIDKKDPALPVSWHKPGQAPGIGLRASAKLSQVPYSYDSSLVAAEVFPEGKLDVDLQQVDLRKTNSWRLKLGEVQSLEMLEVQLVNAVAPFVLCNRLSGLMKKENTGCKHIVNVTAMEGKFHRFKKEARHPHTNMAKAALNMLTHTSASELAEHGIYMNAVDTGWVTDEDPVHISQKKQDVHDFQPPLDIVDGAARICDPFIDGINTGKHWCGQFLKDYFPIDW